MISRTSWVGLCGTAAVAAAVVVVACTGPTPIGTADLTGTGGRSGNGSAGPIIGQTPNGIGGSVAVSTDTPTVSEADGGNCGVTTNDLTKQPADVLLVLDKTGSMTRAMDGTCDCVAAGGGGGGRGRGGNNDVCAAGTCQQRWTTMVSGLNAVLTGASGDVSWGLKLFNSDNGCGVTPTMEVPIAAGSAATVQQTIAQTQTGGSTPTRAAVNAGVAYLKTLTDSNGKYILLATDGEPNCLDTGTVGGGGGNGSTDVDGTVAAITAAATAGFKVYVIGVGPETGNLDSFAVAGGTDHFYPALSPQDLTTALGAIVGAVASCTFNLGTAPRDPTNVVVEFNGDKGLRAPQDPTHTNGWDYTSPSHTTIQLYGSWCDKVTDGTYTSAKVLKGCPNVPIP
jgi:hypothetical protein